MLQFVYFVVPCQQSYHPIITATQLFLVYKKKLISYTHSTKFKTILYMLTYAGLIDVIDLT